MKAAVLRQLNSPLSVEEVKLTKLQFGQVLVKLHVSGLCGAQLQEIAGLKNNEKFLPHLMGHEGCGTITDVGDGVKNVKIGDMVVLHWRIGTGIESDFPEYILSDKIIKSGKCITFSEYSIVSENRLTKIPNTTNKDFAALLGCCLTTSFGIMNNDAHIKLGDSILILGCGGIGLSLIQSAKLLGANSIDILDNMESKRLLAGSNGATNFYNSKEDSTHDKKYDVIVDTTGNSDVISKYIDMLDDNGRFILVTQSNKPLVIQNPQKLFSSNGKTIIATQAGKTVPQVDIPKYVNMFNSGKISIRNLITHRFSLEQINNAIDTLKSGTAGRIMIDME